MQLVFLIAVLVMLAIADAAPQEPAGDAYWRFAGVLGGVAIATLMAMVAAGVTVARLRRWPSQRGQWLARFARYQRLHVWLWSAVVAATAFGLRWGQVVRHDWALGGAVLLDELLLLIPILLPMLLAWAAYYDVERFLYEDTASRTDGSGIPEARGRWWPRSSGRLAFVAVRFRHHVVLWLLPLLVVVAVQDAVRYVRPDWWGPGHAVGIVTVAVAFVILLFPQALRTVWRAYPLPSGPLRSRLEAEANGRGVRFRELLVWPTNDSLAGAAVAGVVPQYRYVFFSDRLLEHLSDEEVAAVLAHEMGHVRHRHMLLRLGLLMAPLLVWQIVVAGWPRVAAWFALAPRGAGHGELPPMLLAIVSLVVLGLYMVAVFGYWSRRLEMQADLFACQDEGDREARPGCEKTSGAGRFAPPAGDALVPWPDNKGRGNGGLASGRTQTFVTALEKLAWLNGTNRRTTTWQHGSIAQRVRLVRRALVDADEARRLHGQVRLLAGCLLVLLVLGCIGCVLGA